MLGTIIVIVEVYYCATDHTGSAKKFAGNPVYFCSQLSYNHGGGDGSAQAGARSGVPATAPTGCARL